MNTVTHQTASLQRQRPATALANQPLIVRGDQNGHTGVIEFGEQLHDVGRQLGVQITGRLVRQQ